MISYAQSRADFEALENIAELEDQQALDERRLDLMENPTKATAAGLYASGIRLWFKEHSVRVVAEEIYTAAKIGTRYGINTIIK